MMTVMIQCGWRCAMLVSGCDRLMLRRGGTRVIHSSPSHLCSPPDSVLVTPRPRLPHLRIQLVRVWITCTLFQELQNFNKTSILPRAVKQGCTPRPGPGGNGCPGPPRPRKFSTLPRPAPEKESAAPPRKLPRGKNRGKCSYIIKSFWESKTFDQYF